MKFFRTHLSATGGQRAFSLIELMMALGIGLVLGGTVILLLLQAAKEQRKGMVNATVEQKAYGLQANITACLRSASANQGITPDYSSGLLDASGNLLGYGTIFVFCPTNGGYLTGLIQYTRASGRVLYTPNVLTPSTQQLWMTNSQTAALTNLCFSTSFNPDGSKNSSLVNVRFQMDDRGYSQSNPTNNPASIYRSFSVQMRND